MSNLIVYRTFALVTLLSVRVSAGELCLTQDGGRTELGLAHLVHRD